MTLSTLPTFTANGRETWPKADDLNTIIAEVNSNYSDQVTSDAALTTNRVNGDMYEVALTATSDGLTTGKVDPTNDHFKNYFAVVTCDDANKIITLPALFGTHDPLHVHLKNGATGYELRTAAPTTCGINGGTGSAAESAIAANTYVVCHSVSGTAWICWQYATNGDSTKTEVAAP